jgi:hypothetical protein
MSIKYVTQELTWLGAFLTLIPFPVFRNTFKLVLQLLASNCLHIPPLPVTHQVEQPHTLPEH